MKGKLIIVTVLAVFVTACASGAYTTARIPPVPPLPKSIAKKITNCEFDFGNRTGMVMNCRNKTHLTMAEAVIVEKWARAKDQEIRLSQQPPVNFSLFEVRTQYPYNITEGRFHRRLYGNSHHQHYYYRGWWR